MNYNIVTGQKNNISTFFFLVRYPASPNNTNMEASDSEMIRTLFRTSIFSPSAGADAVVWLGTMSNTFFCSFIFIKHSRARSLITDHS